MSQSINILWFKRDLRLRDHQPLAEVCKQNRPILLLYVVEDELINDAHYSNRHWHFVWQSLIDMNKQPNKYNARIFITQGDVIDTFNTINKQYVIEHIYSHQETGLANTYNKDKRVADFCHQNNITWHESPYAAVQRGIHSRDWRAVDLLLRPALRVNHYSAWNHPSPWASDPHISPGPRINGAEPGVTSPDQLYCAPMNTLNIEIDAISNLALQVMQAVLDENDKVKRFEEDDSGPLALASALSDFFQIASALQASDQEFDPGQVSELADYGLDLLDRLSFQSQSLELMKHRELVSRMFASIAVWFARRGAELNNLTGAADGFGRLANGLNDTAELAAMCGLMEEVIEAASAELARDEDRSEHWRPWRVLNLNQGIVATRSLDPQLIEQTYEQLTRRLPHDMPGFLANGKRNMIGQNVPDEVQEVVKRYADKWPAPLAH